MKLILFALCLSIGVFCAAQEVDSVWVELDNALKTASSREEKIESKLKAAKYFLNSDLIQSEKYLKDAGTLISNNDLSFSGRWNEYYEILSRKKGNYSKAVEYGLRAKSYYEKISDTLGIVESLIGLGITGRYRNENKQSIEYYKKALSLSKLLKNNYQIAEAYKSMGISYRRLNQLDSALINYNLAEKWNNPEENPIQLVSIRNNKAVLFSIQKKFDQSLPLLLTNLEVNKANNIKMNTSIGYFNIARDYYHLKKYKLSEKYIDSSLNMSKKLGYQFRVSKAYQHKANLALKTGNYQDAYRYNNLYHEISDSIYDRQSENKLKEFMLTQEFNLEKREMELIAESQRAKTMSYIFILIALLVLGFFIAYLWIRNYKGKIKYVATKLDKQRLEKELLDEKVKASEAELKWLVADNKMRLDYLKEFYDRLKVDYDQQSSKESRVYIRSLLVAIQQQIGTEDKLSALQDKIEEVNLGFDTKLIESYPNLTKAEREVCGLLRINLSMKEVASIRNTTVESVKSIRYRLRKKMEVPKNIELESYVQSL